MTWKAPSKHSLHRKTAASVFLKLFIRSNEWCHTTVNETYKKIALLNTWSSAETIWTI